MKGIGLLTALLLTACATKVVPDISRQFRPADETVKAPDGAEHFVLLIGDGGCGCPFAENLAYVPYHVLEAEGFKLIWNKPDGSKVTLTVLEQDKEDDIVVVSSPEPFPRWNERASEAPAVGDLVITFGSSRYINGRVEVLFTYGRVVGARDHRLFTDSLNFPGMSGGCVLSYEGKLLGLNVASTINRLRPDIRPLALSVPVWR